MRGVWLAGGVVLTFTGVWVTFNCATSLLEEQLINLFWRNQRRHTARKRK